MKLLVEVSQGIGNCVQGTPLCHALWLLGHEVDLFINCKPAQADAVAAMWRDWPVLGKVFTRRQQLRVRDYDFGVSCYGRHLLLKLFAPGLAMAVVRTATLGQSETEANVEVARMLGYAADTPPSHVGKSDRDFALPARSITVHAGCAVWAPEKRWPHWPQLCQRLQAQGWNPVLVGTPDDRSPQGWEDAYTNYFQLSLRDLNALLSQASAHLGNDSGVGHLAAAAGLGGLILYGPTSPVKNAPNGRGMATLAAPRQHGQEHELTARQPVPIATLPLEDVWAEVTRVLAQARHEPPRNLPQRAQDSPQARLAFLPALAAMATVPPAQGAFAPGPASINSRGAVYDELEHAYTRLCAENALLAGTGRRTRGQMIRLAGQHHLQLAAAVDRTGGKKVRHTVQVHARDAMRAGLWLGGAWQFVRALTTG